MLLAPLTVQHRRVMLTESRATASLISAARNPADTALENNADVLDVLTNHRLGS